MLFQSSSCAGNGEDDYRNVLDNLTRTILRFHSSHATDSVKIVLNFVADAIVSQFLTRSLSEKLGFKLLVALVSLSFWGSIALVITRLDLS